MLDVALFPFISLLVLTLAAVYFAFVAVYSRSKTRRDNAMQVFRLLLRHGDRQAGPRTTRADQSKNGSADGN